MSSRRARVVGLLVAVVMAGIVIFLIGQSMRISLDVPLARSAAQVLYLKFGPEGTHNADVYVLNAETGTITQMTTNYRVRRATWSEDGESIILAIGDKGRLELLQTGQTRDLPDSEDYTPNYSPDNTYFTYDYCSYDTGKWYGWRETESVFVVETANSSNTQEIKNACFATWSPQGDEIVFSSQESNDADSELYIANRDGSNRRRFLANVGSDVIAQWSPAGTRLMFRSRIQKDNLYREFLFVVDADGQNMAQIDELDGLNSISWSPDGQTLLYNSGGLLCYVKANTSTPDCSLERISSAIWSTDGTRVMYKVVNRLVCLTAASLFKAHCLPGTEDA